MDAAALRACPTCTTPTVSLRASGDRPLESSCERVCETCGAVLGSYVGAAAERVVRLMGPSAP